MPPRRLARRAGYRPARRRTTTRRRKAKSSAKLVLTTGAVLLAISNPAIGIPAVLLVCAALWYTRPGARLASTKPRRTLRARTRTLSAGTNFLALTPTQFEHALADLCRRDGCTNVRAVGGAGDLGADVLATTPDGRRILIQAKRFGPRTTVGSGDVQKVNGTYRDIHHADIAAIITTNRFTKDAALVAHRLKIRAFDQRKLADWASRSGPAPWQ